MPTGKIVMDRVKWTIHPIAHSNEDDPLYGHLYALLPDNGTQGLVIGDVDNVLAAGKRLANFIASRCQSHDGEIAEFHPQLGHRWLYTKDANEEYGVKTSSVTLACRDGKIADARKTRYGWQFSVEHLLAWMEQRPGRGRRARGEQ